MAACIFCDIGKGQTGTEVLFRDDQCFVIQDINPAAPTHLLVIPYAHVTSLEGHGALVGDMLTVAEEMARREQVTSSGYRLVVNQGPDAGQVLPHLHMHLLGGRRLGALG